MNYYILALTLAAVTLQTCLANPQPLIFGGGISGSIQIDSSGNLITDAFRGFGTGIEEFIQTIHETAKSSVTDVENFADSVRNATLKLIEDAERYTQIISDSLQEYLHESMQLFLRTGQAFQIHIREQIDLITNTVKRTALLEISKRLQEINEEVQSLPALVERVRTKWSSEITRQEQNIAAEWNVKAGEWLEYVGTETNGDEDTLEAVDAIISEFINRYGNRLNICADEIEYDLQEYEGRVQEAIERYQTLLDQLIEQVETCLTSDDSDSASRVCRRDVRRQLLQFRTAPAEFLQLKSEGDALLLGSYLRRSCVRQILTDFRLEEYQLQRQIDELIAKYKAQSANVENSESSESDDSQSSDESSEESSESSDESSESSDESSESSGDSEESSEENESTTAASSESDEENVDESSESNGDSEESDEENT